MQNIFDRYQWHPRLCCTPEELRDALREFGAASKKIKALHAIGMAENMEPIEYLRAPLIALADAGVPDEYVRSGKYPYLNKTLLPCSLTLCEPVVFVFEDDSTLEVRPYRNEGLLLGANQISPDVRDGLNRSNVRAEILFEGIAGSTISSIEFTQTQSKTAYTGYDVFGNSATWEFWTDGDLNLLFYHEYPNSGWYRLSTRRHTFGRQGEKIPFSLVKKAAVACRQLPIVEGGNGAGAHFDITPVRRTTPSKENEDGIEKCLEHFISIAEEIVSEFLSVFMDKYFDEAYPYGEIRDSFYASAFDWYAKYNFYTYETMEKMLAEIEECTRLLAEDYDNPALQEVKSKFQASTFYPGDDFYRHRWTAEEEAQLIRDNIHLAVDFYQRFVKRMRQMMKAAPDYDIINVMGL